MTVIVVHCPVCLGALDPSDVMTEGDQWRDARPGDVCLCYYCGTCLTFGINMALLRMTEAEYKSLPSDIRLQLVLERRRMSLAVIVTVNPWFKETTATEAYS